MAGIYVHVPFCKTRCIYCDFYTGTDMSGLTQYVSAICKELEIRKDYIESEAINTIYFGGGTPSQLSHNDFAQIFEAIHCNYNVISDAEITLESNPDDLTSDYLHSLQSLPFNRISMGIQSFDDTELRFLNRRHSAQKAVDAVKSCQDIGFDNISIDLIYGLPKQTIEGWIENLEKAISLNIQHISSYHLIYEEGTKLYNMLKQHKVDAVNEDISVDMFSEMIDRLHGAGFTHYEISNFAKDELYSKHNSSYWLGAKYLGLGPSAHSYDGSNRAWNISSLKEYISGVNNDDLSIEIEVLDIKARYNDFILTGMRTMWGVDLLELKKQFGDEMFDYCLQYVKKHIESGLVDNVNDRLVLTRKGIFVSDNVMSDMMFV